MKTINVANITTCRCWLSWTMLKWGGVFKLYRLWKPKSEMSAVWATHVIWCQLLRSVHQSLWTWGFWCIVHLLHMCTFCACVCVCACMCVCLYFCVCVHACVWSAMVCVQNWHSEEISIWLLFLWDLAHSYWFSLHTCTDVGFLFLYSSVYFTVISGIS